MYVADNSDYDDGSDDIMDKYKEDVMNEDDLLRVYLDVYPYEVTTGNVTVERSNHRIKLWRCDHPNKEPGTEIFGDSNIRTWTLEHYNTEIADKVCWIEGVDVSEDLKDTELRISFADAEDKARFTVCGVDLDIDSDNDNGYGHPDCDSDEEEIESDDGSMEKMGKHIHVNDYDFDCDMIPDWLDGFGAVNDVTYDEQISEGHFPQLVLKLCVPPDMPDCEVEFIYSADNPGAIDSMSLNEAKNYVPHTPLFAKLRIWSKDANERRYPGSVVDDEDFVPSGVRISADKFSAFPAETVLYVEGIYHSSQWGGSKIRVNIYRSASDEEPCLSDEVSTTVTRNLFRLCVWRAYLYREGNPHPRTAFVADYTSPRTAFSSLIDGLLFPDEDYHKKGAYMGHAFAHCEFAGPISYVYSDYWTGQTGQMKVELISAYSAFKDGEVYWHSDSGEEDDEDVLQQRFIDYYLEDSGPRIVNHTGLQPLEPKMLAVHEFRVMPQTACLLREYRENIHYFGDGQEKGYGLDINLSAPRIGCGSYIGVMMDYAGLSDGQSEWLVDEYTKVIPLDSLPPLAVFITDIDSYLEDARAEMDADPYSASWATPGTERRLRFFDPAKMSIWIDQRNTKMNHDRGVTIYYNAPTAGDLSKWSYQE